MIFNGALPDRYNHLPVGQLRGSKRGPGVGIRRAAHGGGALKPRGCRRPGRGAPGPPRRALALRDALAGRDGLQCPLLHVLGLEPEGLARLCGWSGRGTSWVLSEAPEGLALLCLWGGGGGGVAYTGESWATGDVSECG